MESTPAPATPRRMLAPAPLKRERTPSLAMICRPASMEDLYLTAWVVTMSQYGGHDSDITALTSPEVIIIRLRIVSKGYEAIPAPVVTPQPSKKDAKKFPSKG